MGVAPPPDGPPLAAQQQVSADATFALGPPVAELCGIKIPSFQFGLNLNIGAVLALLLPSLPTFDISLGLNCSESNPLDVTAGVAWGGGRVGQSDPDPDLALDQATS